MTHSSFLSPKPSKPMIFSKKIAYFALILLALAAGYAVMKKQTLSHKPTDVVTLFPLQNYDQQLTHWVKPSDSDYTKTLLSKAASEHHGKILYANIFGQQSPWSKTFIDRYLKKRLIITKLKDKINEFSNTHKSNNTVGFNENFRPYSSSWIKKITQNINLIQFKNLSYQPDQRAIVIANLNVRHLPTNDVHFYNHHIAGQGYPFDNLQNSSLWIGTPVYVLGHSKDKSWVYILTNDVRGWVPSNGIAYTSSNFIKKWQASAKKQLVAITHTETSLISTSGKFIETAYIGTLLPGTTIKGAFKLQVPISDTKQKAQMTEVVVENALASPVPLTLNPYHMIRLMQELIGRPYGWGNAYFYNDCSAELKNLFSVFGIWLPRDSSKQISVGEMQDKSELSPKERIQFLKSYGQKFLTLVYIGGHVFLYMGNYQDPETKSERIMTYQNIWGLRPADGSSRAVIGKAVLLPLLEKYSEKPELQSLAAGKYFQVVYLDTVK